MFINTLETYAELNFFIGHIVSMYEDYLLSIIWYQMNGRLFRLFRCDYFMYACALEIREVMAWLGCMHVRKSGSLQKREERRGDVPPLKGWRMISPNPLYPYILPLIIHNS